MPEQDHEFDAELEALPEALTAALREADEREHGQPTPAATDDEVLAMAREHFAAQQQTAPSPAHSRLRLSAPPDVPGSTPPTADEPAPVLYKFPRWGAALAAAAAIAVGILTWQVMDHLTDSTRRMTGDLSTALQNPPHLGPGSPAELAWDADRSGTLDILDILILARQHKAGNANVTPDILDDLGSRIVSLDRVSRSQPVRQLESSLAWLGIDRPLFTGQTPEGGLG